MNHPEIEATRSCDACGRPFCENCLVEIMGRRLCSGCKVEAVVGVGGRKQRHPLAVPALVVPIAGWAVFCLLPVTSILGLYLGWRVVRETEESSAYSGQSAGLAAIAVSIG